MKLYDKDECPFCWKIRLALSYKNISYDEITIDTNNKPDAFLEISPTGKVPVLDDNGLVINESTLIIHYLEDRNPQPSLYPGDTAERHQLRMLNHYSDTIIGPRIRDAIFTQRDNTEELWDKDAIKRSQEGWIQCLEELQPLLGSEKFFGKAFSIAECALIPRFALADAYNLTGLDKFPALDYWFNYHRDSNYFKDTAAPLCLPSLNN